MRFLTSSLAMMTMVLSACGDINSSSSSGSIPDPSSNSGDNSSEGGTGSIGTPTTENDPANAAALALLGAEKALLYVAMKGASAAQSQSDSMSQSVVEHLTKLAKSLAQNSTGAPQEFPCPSSGKVETDFPFHTFADNEIPKTGEAFFEYKQCDLGKELDGLTLDGSMNLNWSGGFNRDKKDFKKLTIDFDLLADDKKINATVDCDSYGQECVMTDNDSDKSVRYGLKNVAVTKQGSAGYDLKASISRDDLTFNIAGSALLPCKKRGFESGEIAVTDMQEKTVLEISFNNCETMAVTYNGRTERYNQ